MVIFKFCWWETWFYVSGVTGTPERIANLGSGCVIKTSNLEVGTSELSEGFFGDKYYTKRSHHLLHKIGVLNIIAWDCNGYYIIVIQSRPHVNPSIAQLEERKTVIG